MIAYSMDKTELCARYVVFQFFLKSVIWYILHIANTRHSHLNILVFVFVFVLGGKSFCFLKEFYAIFPKKNLIRNVFFRSDDFFPWKCTHTEAIINNMPLCKIWSWWDIVVMIWQVITKFLFCFFIILPSMAHFENDILISHKKICLGFFVGLDYFSCLFTIFMA